MADDARQAELRGLLAEAVPEWVGLCDEEPITLADALLPVVERFAAEQAAAALNDAADISLLPFEDASDLRRQIRARAAAVLAAPDNDRRQG